MVNDRARSLRATTGSTGHRYHCSLCPTPRRKKARHCHVIRHEKEPGASLGAGLSTGRWWHSGRYAPTNQEAHLLRDSAAAGCASAAPVGSSEKPHTARPVSHRRNFICRTPRGYIYIRGGGRGEKRGLPLPPATPTVDDEDSEQVARCIQFLEQRSLLCKAHRGDKRRLPLRTTPHSFPPPLCVGSQLTWPLPPSCLIDSAQMSTPASSAGAGRLPDWC